LIEEETYEDIGKTSEDIERTSEDIERTSEDTVVWPCDYLRNSQMSCWRGGPVSAHRERMCYCQKEQIGDPTSFHD
jgi:hypothetical protein